MVRGSEVKGCSGIPGRQVSCMLLVARRHRECVDSCSLANKRLFQEEGGRRVGSKRSRLEESSKAGPQLAQPRPLDRLSCYQFHRYFAVGRCRHLSLWVLSHVKG